MKNTWRDKCRLLCKRGLIYTLTLSLLLGIGITAVPTAVAAESEQATIRDLFERWTKKEGDYPGKDKVSIIPGKDKSYLNFVIGYDGVVEKKGTYATAPMKKGTFTAGHCVTIATNGASTTGNLTGTSGVKLKCPENSERSEFYQWITFATIDEACKWAEDGDTIVLNSDYDDYTLNGLHEVTAEHITKNDSATVEYKVSPNFTIPADKNITLDLNGHTIQASTNYDRQGTVPQGTNWVNGAHYSTGEVTQRIGITVSEGASLTIIDSSEGKTGKIVGAERAKYQESENDETYVVNESEQFYHLIDNKGTLIIAEDVKLENPARAEGNQDDPTAYTVYQAPNATTILPESLTVTDEFTTNAGTAGEGGTPPVVSYAMQPASVTVGNTTKMAITPTLPTGALVEWTSDDGAVATVDATGVVTGVSAGNATITAKITLNGAVLAEVEATVTVTAASSGGGSTTYPIAAPKADNGAITVSPTRASKGRTVTLTVTPDKGYELDKVTVTDAKGNELDLTDKGDGKYTFTMPGSKVTVNATFTKAAVDTGFVDVPADAYFADAVQWAVDKKITTGTSATTFSPNASCTRGQMVTFLWRAAGSPAVTGENPFSDVKADAYYYDAVLWAVQKGITTGVTATTFAPEATVTRGQTVTFLYRNAGTPAATGNAFADVPADAYYAKAVAWAVAEKITNGTSDTTFSPNADCTRGQIVTFLYRDAT